MDSLIKICSKCSCESKNIWKSLCKKCYMANYRAENKEKLKEKTKEYRINNPEKVKKWKADWSKTEKGKAYNSEYLTIYRNLGKTKHIELKYRLKNTEKTALRCKKWKENNKDRHRLNQSNRRSLKLKATPNWFGELDELVLSEAFSLAVMKEKVTGIKWHIDHIIPLKGKAVCGLHCWNNIQVITAKENLSKSNFFKE